MGNNFKKQFCEFSFLISAGPASVNTLPTVWEEVNRWAKRRKEENKASQQSSMYFHVSVPSFWSAECCNLNCKFPGRQMTDVDWRWFQNNYVFSPNCKYSSAHIWNLFVMRFLKSGRHRSNQSQVQVGLVGEKNCSDCDYLADITSPWPGVVGSSFFFIDVGTSKSITVPFCLGKWLYSNRTCGGSLLCIMLAAVHYCALSPKRIETPW